MKILITEGSVVSTGDISFDCFNKFGAVKIYDNITYSELENEITDTDILLCNKIPVDKNILSKAKNLKYVGAFATGYNNIDVDTCREKGIIVCNAKDYSTDAVSQQTFAYILDFACKLKEYDGFVKNNGWIESPVFSPIAFPTTELSGKTLGIIGYGSIGKAVAKIARAFNMRVVVNTRTVREDAETEFCDLETLLSVSDFVSVHCPLTKDNQKMFNKQTFAKFKKGAFFINTARGGLVDENALFDALESGHLGGAAVDVIETEPMLESCPLLKAKNITITPHSAWIPYETRQRLFGVVVDNIEAFLSGNPQNKVW